MKGRVLVIGGAGFLGSHLLQLLLLSPKSRYDGELDNISHVRVFDIVGIDMKTLESTCSDPDAVVDDRKQRRPMLEVIQGDILDKQQLDDAMRGQ
jgi:nucleoside-diphosphate-sugar epimerase